MGSSFWTMTPAGGYNSFGNTNWSAGVFFVFVSGTIDDLNPSNSSGLRPTINLKADVTIIGDGTLENPYKVA